MTLALLIGKVVVAWVFVSVGGFAVVLGVAEWRWRRRERRTNVAPFPQSTHVRVVDRDGAV